MAKEAGFLPTLKSKKINFTFTNLRLPIVSVGPFLFENESKTLVEMKIQIYNF